MKLFDRGEPNQVLMQIVRVNVRQPDEVIGDFYAQTASNDAGGRALLEMMEEFGLDSIDPMCRRNHPPVGAAVRGEIAKLPNGEWSNETWSDGFEEPILIRCMVRVAGDEIFIDFSRLLAAEHAGNQCRSQLHARLRELRYQSGDLS